VTWWIWILIIVAALVLVAGGTGLVVGRRRRVSLTPTGSAPDAGKSAAPGGYRAGGSISFAPGGASATDVEDRAAAPDELRWSTPAEEPAEEPTAPAEAVIPELPGAQTPPAEEIAPTAGRLQALRGRLSKSQSAFGRSLLGMLGGGDLDDDSWQDIEDTLLMADLGSTVALQIAATLREKAATRGVADAAAARALLREVLIDAVGADTDRSVKALAADDRPAVVLVVGVNGTGKTTTTGKLAREQVADGRSVELGAADTYRAAPDDHLAT
jgi:fused signal recognition particle receptor